MALRTTNHEIVEILERSSDKGDGDKQNVREITVGTEAIGPLTSDPDKPACWSNMHSRSPFLEMTTQQPQSVDCKSPEVCRIGMISLYERHVDMDQAIRLQHAVHFIYRPLGILHMFEGPGANNRIEEVVRERETVNVSHDINTRYGYSVDCDDPRCNPPPTGTDIKDPCTSREESERIIKM